MAIVFNVEVGGNPIQHVTKLEAYKIDGTDIVDSFSHEIYDYYELYKALVELDELSDGSRVYSCGLFCRDAILKDIEHYRFHKDFKLLINTLTHNHRTIKDLYSKYIDETCRNSKEMVCNTQGVNDVSSVNTKDLVFVYISIVNQVRLELNQVFDNKRMRQFVKDFNQIHALHYSIQRRGAGYTIKDRIANKVVEFDKFNLLRTLSHIIVIDYYEHDFKYVSREEYKIFKNLADIDGYHYMYV